MYENNQYTNADIQSRNGQMAGQNQNGQMAGQSRNSTVYGRYYRTAQSAPQAPENAGKAKQQKKKGKAGSLFRKAVACAGFGLCFGLFAGAGFFAVTEGTGMFADERQTGTSLIEESFEGLSEAQKAEIRQLLAEGTSDTGVMQTNHITMVNTDISDMVDEVMPSMVSIVNEYVERISYFGQVIEQEGSSSGSGIIVGENETELLIATNYHVVEGASHLQVYFIDDTSAEAVVKGTDSDMDLAVIAIKLEDLEEDTRRQISVAKLGDSDALELGEPVIAIGNALGYGQSVTDGIVSALNRELQLEDGSTGTFIQTNAAINPGNSGGALLNIKGEVVGINSNKIGGTVVEGMGYAIPISAAQPILEDLMAKETRNKVDTDKMGYLGIVPQSVSADAASLRGMPEGVFVSQVDEGTPAAEAGMLYGDIITKFDGSRLYTAEELRSLLEYYESGETVEVLVYRMNNGKYEEVVLQVTLGSRPTGR